MTMIPWTTHIRDEEKIIVPDFDCTIEVETHVDEELEIKVVGVWVDRACRHDAINLMISKSTHIRIIGCNIAEDAEGSEAFRDKVCEEENIIYVGGGGNDPDGKMVRVRL